MKDLQQAVSSGSSIVIEVHLSFQETGTVVLLWSLSTIAACKYLWKALTLALSAVSCISSM